MFDRATPAPAESGMIVLRRPTVTMTRADRTYVPAAGRDWALPLYDPLVWILGGTRTRNALIDQAALRPGQRVLDIGCGTGTLLVMAKRAYPDVDFVGLDPDPKALDRARRKAARARLAIRFDQGFSGNMTYADAEFDRVWSSFMFHHLGRSERQRTLREIRRVLKPGGTFHLVDFLGAAPASGRLLEAFAEAGLANGRIVAEDAMLFGRMPFTYLSAST
jgi:SAM-dependent methyltransferase